MKFTQINEVGSARRSALITIDWGEYTQVYGPFNSWDAARKFVDDMEAQIEASGFEDFRDLGIFDVDVQQPQDPQEAVDTFQRRLQGYIDDRDED